MFRKCVHPCYKRWKSFLTSIATVTSSRRIVMQGIASFVVFYYYYFFKYRVFYTKRIPAKKKKSYLMLQRTDSESASMFHDIPWYCMYPLRTHLFPNPRGLLDFILPRISRHRLRLLRTRFEGR